MIEVSKKNSIFKLLSQKKLSKKQSDRNKKIVCDRFELFRNVSDRKICQTGSETLNFEQQISSSKRKGKKLPLILQQKCLS